MEIFILFCVIVTIAAIATSIKIVKQQTLAIVELFGKYSKTLEPGLCFILPFGIESIVSSISLKVMQVESEVEVKTKDNQFILMPTTTMFKVIPDVAAKAYYKLDNASDQIQSWILNSIKSQASDMTLEELFSDRESLETQTKSNLDKKLEDYGYEIISVLVSQPTVSESVQNSFNRAVASEKEKETAKNEAEAARIRTVAQAKAEAEAQAERARGLSEARQIIARGLEESIKTLQESGVSSETAMTLLLETNRLDMLRDVGKHNNLIITDSQSNTQLTSTLMLKQIKDQ